MSLKANFPNLAETLRKARFGDAKALKTLKLDPDEHSGRVTKLAKIKEGTLQKDAIKNEIAHTIFAMEAAARLGMSNTQQLYRDRQAYLTQMYEQMYKERPVVGKRLKNTRLLVLMQTLVQENMEDIIDLSSLEANAGEALHLEEEQDGDIPSNENKEKEGVDQGEEEWDSNSSDSYDPAKDSAGGDSSSDDEEERQQGRLAKRPFPSTSTLAKNKQPSSESLPATKKTKSSAPLPKSASPSPSRSASPPASQSDNENRKRSHHKRKECPVPKCSFNGSDLRRHLGVHVKKGDIEEGSIESLLAIVRAGPQQRGKIQKRKGRAPLKGKLKKWCPIPGCKSMVLDIGRHLSNPTYHNIKKGSREHQRYVRMAKRYTGLAELEDSLVKPPPPIVQLDLEEDPNQEDPLQKDPNQADPHQKDPNQEDPNQEDPHQPNPNQEDPHQEGPNQEDPHQVDPNQEDPHLEDPNQKDNYSEEDSEEKSYSEEDLEKGNYSEEDPEDEEYATKSKPSRNEFFTAANPTNNRHRWLVKFFEFLTRPTAGDKKKSIRLQHANQMRTLLEEVDPEGDDILCLLDNEGDAVWQLWVKPHLEAKTKNPGTIISYLTSFQKFLEFVTHDRFNKTAPPIHPDYVTDFKTLLKDIKGWRSTVDCQSYDVKNDRMVQESEGLLMLEELAQIKSSKPYSETKRLLIQAEQGMEVNLKEFLHVRDYLLTRFSLDTATRPGPLNNATLQEYEKGNVQDQCKVMLVAKHKRAKDGPAICPMLPELYKSMETYVRKMRPLFVAQNSDALFITNEGIPFKDGTIGRRLSAFVEKCGVRLGSRMAFVDMRKVITTEMLKRANPEERAILRRVLAHSKRTSEEWYSRPDLTDIGVKAAHIIQRLVDHNVEEKSMSSSSASQEVAGPSNPPSPEASISKEVARPTSPTSALTSAEHTALSSRPTSPVQTAPSSRPTPSSPAASTRSKAPSSSPSSDATTLVSGIVQPSPLKQILSELQKSQVEWLFKKEIDCQSKVTMEIVQTRMARNSILATLATKPSRVKQVVNFVNELVRKQGKTATPPPAKPPAKAKSANWLDQFDDPETRSQSIRRMEWDPEDSEKLERAFKGYRKLPTTFVIRTILNGDTELSAIKSREGWTRVYNKIKNIFRNKK